MCLTKSEQFRATASGHNRRAMRIVPETPQQIADRSSPEYAELIRRIWKEGRERSAHSVLEARRVDKDEFRAKARKSR